MTTGDQPDIIQHGATLYSIQLALNLLWTPLYFGIKQPIAASVDILALGGTLAYLINVWGQVDPVCGWLLAPYLGWVSFATYLCVRALVGDVFTSCQTNTRLDWIRLFE